MANSDSVIPAEVRDLIQESQKIQGWVERMSEHSGEVRQEVFEKVRRDYQGRLQSVHDRLADHRVSLGDTLETRRAELASLRADRDEHAAELEEAKLRHAVGEFSDSEWKKRKEGIEQTLEDLDKLLEAEEDTVSELAEIIGSIGSTGPRLVVEGGEAGDTEAEDATAAGEPADAPAEEAVGGKAYETPAMAAVSAEEVTDDDPEATSDPEAVVEGPKPRDEGDEGGEYLDELEFLESLSLGETDRFDAVSAMLDEEEGTKPSD